MEHTQTHTNTIERQSAYATLMQPPLFLGRSRLNYKIVWPFVYLLLLVYALHCVYCRRTVCSRVSDFRKKKQQRLRPKLFFHPAAARKNFVAINIARMLYAMCPGDLHAQKVRKNIEWDDSLCSIFGHQDTIKFILSSHLGGRVYRRRFACRSNKKKDSAQLTETKSEL